MSMHDDRTTIWTRLCRATAAAALFVSLPSTATAQVGWVDESYDLIENQWITSGHIGSSFGDQVTDQDLNFGGSLSYLRNGIGGFELLAGFAPDVAFTALGSESRVNNYMLNGIAALPLGSLGQWQPFISAGVGALTIRNQAADSPDDFDFFEVDDTQLGGNIGFGIMGFGDRWGFRSEVRYCDGFDDEDGSLIDDPPVGDLLSPADFLGNVKFWRANVGLAYRW